jgi:hypothetical protein
MSSITLQRKKLTKSFYSIRSLPGETAFKFLQHFLLLQNFKQLEASGHVRTSFPFHFSVRLAEFGSGFVTNYLTECYTLDGKL